MSTPGSLPVRLARSSTVSALAVCAAVLAHVVADGHTPPVATALTVGAAVTLADLIVATWFRRPWTLVVRLVGLQVAVHVAVSTAALASGRSGVSVRPHHGGVAAPASTAPPVGWADLLPSVPMMLAHLAVAVVVGFALVTVARSAELPRSARLAVEQVRRLALPGTGVLALLLAAPVPVLRRLPRGTDAPTAVPAGPRHLVAARTVVRRGPPALLPA